MNIYYKDDSIKLIHGDCLQVMDKLIQEGIKIDAIITDIPYGITQCKWDGVIPFEDMWNRLNKLRNDNTPIVLFGSEPFTSKLICSNLGEFKERLLWEKHKPSNFANAKTKHMKYTEDVVVFYKKQCIFNRQYETRESDRVRQHQKDNYNPTATVRQDGNEVSLGTDYGVRDIHRYDADLKLCGDIIKGKYLANNSKEKTSHSTQKPLSLMEYLINTYTNKNDLILDFTCGSGTTLVAAKKLGRKAIGIELEEKYCEITKNRILQIV